MKNIIAILAFCLFYLACQEKKLNNLTIKDLDFEKAKSLMYKDNDSAFFHFNKVATNSVDSLMVAQAYTFMATIQTESSDYFGSQESLILSLRFLNEQKTSNFDCLSSTYNELGLTNYYLKNYKIALTYFEKALYFSADDVFSGDFSNSIHSVLFQSVQPTFCLWGLSQVA